MKTVSLLCLRIKYYEELKLNFAPFLTTLPFTPFFCRNYIGLPETFVVNTR